jgi:hypothetical protein
MQREDVEAAALAGIEPLARIEDLSQSGAAGDIGAVGFGVIKAGAPELEEVDCRGEDQQEQEGKRECDSAQSCNLLRMRCEPRCSCACN